MLHSFYASIQRMDPLITSLVQKRSGILLGWNPMGLKEATMKAVIQCGGKGTRLRPYTSVLPKPLMPIGARPVLELLLKWLRRNGVQDVYVTTGYLGHLIRSVCGDG